jgi:uncharacterized protein (DUF1778 family)
MATNSKAERLDLRLPAQAKRVIEQAAAQLGQSVSAFVVATATRHARELLRDQSTFELSARDRDRFLAALDDAKARPPAALRRAARRHKKLIG